MLIGLLKLLFIVRVVVVPPAIARVLARKALLRRKQLLALVVRRNETAIPILKLLVRVKGLWTLLIGGILVGPLSVWWNELLGHLLPLVRQLALIGRLLVVR